MFSTQSRTGRGLARAFFAVGILLLSAHAALARPVRTANADITGVVTDAASGQPLVTSLEVGVLGSHRAERGEAECPFEGGVARPLLGPEELR